MTDLNMAFAKHWDKQNPSNFVRSCDESRRLQEDDNYSKRNSCIISSRTEDYLKGQIYSEASKNVTISKTLDLMDTPSGTAETTSATKS